MYFVLSYDFGRDSFVRIDAMTSNLEAAKAKYKEIVAENQYAVLVNMIEITKEFTEESIPLFFTSTFKADGCKLLATNND